MRIRLSAIGRLFHASMAPFLVLVTPFVVYLQYQQYGFTRPEVMSFVLVLAAVALVIGAGMLRSSALGVAALAGLLTFFVDVHLVEPGLKRLALVFIVFSATLWVLRRHAARIVAAMMATLIALSLFPPRSEAVSMEPPPSASRGDLPLILHLVLDEYIGIEGFPPNLVPPAFNLELQSFFVGRGFRLFGKAFSEYGSTLWSLSHLLNLAPGGYTPALTAPAANEGRYRLTRNAYFDRFAQQGYAVRVYQPDYLDMCTASVPPSACHTYRARSLETVGRLAVPARDKIAIIAGTYLARSEAYLRMWGLYIKASRPLRDAGVWLPAWNWERPVGAPVASMALFDTLALELSRAQSGTVLFAHLLLPHYPYIYDASCRPRPPSEWLLRSDEDRVDVPGGFTNRPDGRAARYSLYVQQITCVQRKVALLIEAIPASMRGRAIVVIQGDHGSRISLTDPVVASEDSLAPSDYADHFSTLFAVRSPYLEAGYDLRSASITCLLRTLVESDFRSAAGVEACSSPNVVFLRGNKTPTARPVPPFGSIAVDQSAAAVAAGAAFPDPSNGDFANRPGSR